MRLVSPLTFAPERWSGWRLWALVLLLAVLSGCSTTKYTVDDGRPVNEALLGQIRSYGAGEKAVRQAIGRSAGLQDKDCDKQWELPFAVASSYGWDSADDRVAWARALNVDERVTLIDVLPDSGLAVGDRIEAVAGYSRENSEKMLQELALKRDAGQSFELRLVGGRRVPVQPFAVCRGYTRFAPPSTPQAQDYHWLMSLHPLELADARLTDDEALWAVLWTQGLSEEGGARMKTYHYGTKVVGTLYNVVTLATGLRVNSVPGPDEKPQAFETVEPLEARWQWNAMRAMPDEERVPGFGARETWLAGTATQLDVLEARVALTDSRNNQLQANYSHNVAVASLRKAIGAADPFVTKP